MNIIASMICLCLCESLGVIGGVRPSAKSSFHKPVCPSSRASQVLQQTCGSPQRGDFGKWDGDLSRAKSQTQGTASGSVCKMQQTSSYSILQRVTMISWIMCLLKGLWLRLSCMSTTLSNKCCHSSFWPLRFLVILIRTESWGSRPELYSPEEYEMKV